MYLYYTVLSVNIYLPVILQYNKYIYMYIKYECFIEHKMWVELNYKNNANIFEWVSGIIVLKVLAFSEIA